MVKKFDYQGAKDEGYSDEEITSFLSEKHPKFDLKGASEEGYSTEEINQFLSNYQPKKSYLEKGARIAGQYALGAAENALIPYELAVAPLASKDAQNIAYGETLGEDLERLMDQKAMGQWDEQDQKLYEHITNQILHPEESEKYVKTQDIGVRGLAEKVTGLDLQPEGVLEKAANWSGFIKDPKKISQLASAGIKPSNIIKAISPTGKEAMRGIGAGMALQLAEQGHYGPIGTM